MCVGAQRPDYRWRLGLACVGAQRPDMLEAGACVCVGASSFCHFANDRPQDTLRNHEILAIALCFVFLGNVLSPRVPGRAPQRPARIDLGKNNHMVSQRTPVGLPERGLVYQKRRPGGRKPYRKPKETYQNHKNHQKLKDPAPT